MLNLNFINLVKNNINTEAFVKFNYDFIKSPECEFADYVRKNINQNKLMEIKQLDLECCFAGDLTILIV
jgi:hypothetical protein